MIELFGAVAGAMIGVTGLAAGSMIKRSGEGRDAIIKLTVGIEHIGKELQALREDMREDRHEIYGRLSEIEQRLSSLEARQ